MSRIGIKPIVVPADVTVKIDGQNITVTGKLGTLSRTINPNLSVNLLLLEIVKMLKSKDFMDYLDNSSTTWLKG